MTNEITDTIKGTHYKTGKLIEVIIKKGHISAINELKEKNKMKQVITPGLVDIQINGYKGYDFNKRALSKEEWDEVILRLLNIGVTTFYPTIITSSFHKLSMVLEENIKVLNSNNMYNGMVGGFHLEGPYLSILDGPRGAHEKEFIRAPNWEEFCRLQESAQGQIKIITISPEWDYAVPFIEKVTESGVKVAIGHTAANSKQIRAAVEAGAVLSTHLGNGAHVMLPRHPNYIWDQLAEDKLWISVIADSHHLPQNVLKVFQRVKSNKMILVSDSVALAGKESGDYITSVGGEVTLTKSGRLHLKSKPELLAGSVQNLLQGIQHCVRTDIASRSEAFNKASIYPADLMNLRVKFGLNVGAPADLIVINEEGYNWEVVKVFKKGKQKI